MNTEIIPLQPEPHSVPSPSRAKPKKLASTVWKLLPITKSIREFAQAVCLVTLGNSSKEADHIFNSAREKAEHIFVPKGSHFIKADSLDGLSGIDLKDGNLRIGTPEAIESWLRGQARTVSQRTLAAIEFLSRHGGEILLVADQYSELGIIFKAA